ncbi:DUF4190 domain-containing protein [Streptomyces sp. NPDC038707]|uniref:DUF4190 domain-containing protein n=1 Tax=unclassified Streptomyces TaxID=2593676 RepID=UPI0033CA187A
MSISPPSGPHQPEGPVPPPREPCGPPPYPQPPGAAQGLPGYQPWTQGYRPYNVPAPVNGLAIASLVLGVLCFLPGAGLVLGLTGLRQIRRRGERGTGLAMGGAVLSGVGLLIWALLFATGGASAVWHGIKEGARDGATVSLTEGECFNAPGGALSGVTYDVDTVPCSGAHDGEAFASFRLPGGGPYPGDDAVTDTADERCRRLRDGYAMDGWALPEYVEVYFLTPTEESWAAGDHEVTCVFGNSDEDGRLTGSLREDETVLDADQVAYLKAAHVLNAALETAPDEPYPEDDLPGHKAWAGRVSAALGEQARMLRAHSWPAGTAGLVSALGADLDKARAEWAKAAVAGDADAFSAHYENGLDLIDPVRAVPLRAVLELATTPPMARDDERDGGSGTGMQV